jgi:excisionase family DNA binding protein
MEPNRTKKRLITGNPMSMMETDQVLTTDQAIEYLRISKPTFLKYIRVGKIRAVKAGKGWRILQSELHRFLTGKTDSGNV